MLQSAVKASLKQEAGGCIAAVVAAQLSARAVLRHTCHAHLLSISCGFALSIAQIRLNLRAALLELEALSQVLLLT